MRSKQAKVFSLLTLAFTWVCPAWSYDLLLKNAKLVDPDKRTIQSTSLLIRDGKITTSEISDRPPEKTIDLEGKWVIPGLIDLHDHFSNNPLANGDDELFDVHETARVMLYCGVVAFLDLANGHYDKLFDERNRQRAVPDNFADESDIYCAGAAFGHWNLSSPSATPGKIADYIKQWQPDVIKLIYGKGTLDRAKLAAAIGAANKAGVKTVVHIGSWQHAQDAIESGATAVTHFFDDEVIPWPVAKVWSKSKTVSIPTMAVQCDMANFVAHPSLLQSPLLQEIETPKALATFNDRASFCPKAKHTLEWQEEDLNNDMQSFRRLQKLKIPMLAGSDSSNMGTFQGFSLHRELKIMQDAGYSPWEALAAGTTGADRFLSRPSGIVAGDTAELVVLDANPIDDVGNTQKIFAIVHHGKLLDRKALLTRVKERTN
jgi:imidazolonepropionase-like amidohydrolase